MIGSVEIIVMYLLVWFDMFWVDINIDKDGIFLKYYVIFDKEYEVFNGFVK